MRMSEGRTAIEAPKETGFWGLSKGELDDLPSRVDTHGRFGWRLRGGLFACDAGDGFLELFLDRGR